MAGHQPSYILERKIKALCILYHTIGTNSGFALGQLNNICPKWHESSGVTTLKYIMPSRALQYPV